MVIIQNNTTQRHKKCQYMYIHKWGEYAKKGDLFCRYKCKNRISYKEKTNKEGVTTVFIECKKENFEKVKLLKKILDK